MMGPTAGWPQPSPDRPARPSFEDVVVGARLPTRSEHLDRARLIQYAGASLDRNLIHWDERFATSVGLPDVIAHGMLTMAVAVETVSRWAGAERIVDCGTRFTAPVVVPYLEGADVEIGAVVVAVEADTRRVVVELSATCAGRRVLGKARVTVDLS